jgi:hypothetical protein
LADVVIRFAEPPPRIGLIVRGKRSPAHHPGLWDQHADVILSDGSPAGFYGEENGSAGNSVAMGLQGVVYDYPRLRIERPFYVNVDRAMANRVVSTVLLLQVSADQAHAFDSAWKGMALHPGNFNIVGGNCSSHASAAFIEAGVLRRGIPGLDTPDNLYGQLVADLLASSLQSLTGFIGFSPTPRGGFEMAVKAYVDSPAINTPNPGTARSFVSQRGGP